MKSLFVSLFCFIALSAMAGGPTKITDINAALAKAKAEKKLLFLQIGKADCDNCNELRGMVARDKVKLPASQFVYADVDFDDGATLKVFRRHFKVLGVELPFVVVASPEGKQLGARYGRGTPEDFADLIAKAQAKLSH